MENKVKKIILIVMIVSGLTCTANAVLILQSQPFSGVPTFNQTLTFDQFDNSGGLTLQSIEVKFYLESDGGQLTLDNDGVDPASGVYAFGAQGSISSSDVGLFNNDAIPQPVTADLDVFNSGSFSLQGDDGDGTYNLDPTPDDGAIYLGSLVAVGASDFIGNAFFTAYIGTGNFDIRVDALQWANFGGIGGIEYFVTPTDIEGSVEVIYTYIPEPMTISLMSIGSLALLRKRRK